MTDLALEQEIMRGPAAQFGRALERLLPGYTFTASLAAWDDGKLCIEFDLEPDLAPVS